MVQVKKAKAIDPVTFEVMKNRMWAINEEQANIAMRASGSLIVYDCHDFNSAITDGKGRGLYTGSFNIILSTTVPLGVKWILANFPRDYIKEGDMFIFNDPWAGSVHQNDYTMVAPIFYDGDIIAWSGVCMHEPDVGGPKPGSIVVGARNAYEEAPIVPPIKIVKRGEVQKDIMGLLCRNSRLPLLFQLDILARVSAMRINGERICQMAKGYGKETFIAFTKKLIDYVRDNVADRLRRLPDGTWFELNYQDHDGTDNVIYPAKLAMTKRGDKLTFDFTGTCEQAPGLINCTWSGLQGGILVVLFSMLCYRLPFSSGALEQLYDVICEEGTQVNVKFPGAVGLGPVGASWMVRLMLINCISKMMVCSEESKDLAFVSHCPPFTVLVFSGLDQRGRPFVNCTMDPIGGGSGARTYRDGIDTGGAIDIPGMGMPDVEMEEYNYPQLILWRKERKDSFGPGKFRGGVGVEFATIPHKNPIPIENVLSTTSVAMPGAFGICGGLPCNCQFNAIFRESNVRELFKSGEMPTDMSEISGRLDVRPAKSFTQLGNDDVFLNVVGGGAGYGDPLDRDPKSVEKDIRGGLCSQELARDIFGVIVDPASLNVDQAATEKRRKEILQKRLSEGKPVSPVLAEEERKSSKMPKKVIMPIGETIRVVRQNGELFFECTKCSYNYGSTKIGDPKRNALMREKSISEVNSMNKHGLIDEFVVREFYCPGCGTMIAVNMQRKEEPIAMDMHLTNVEEKS